jgi:hypothetical protein
MPRSSRWAKHRQMMGDHLWGAETCAALGKADPPRDLGLPSRGLVPLGFEG